MAKSLTPTDDLEELYGEVKATPLGAPGDPDDDGMDDYDDPDDVMDDDGGSSTPDTSSVPSADTSTTSDPSTTGNGANAQGQQSKANSSKPTTAFEEVGLMAGRKLAVVRSKNVNKTKPEAADPFKGETLADMINYKAELILSQTGKNNQDGAMKNQGFVNRTVPSYDDKDFLDQVVEMAFETSGAGSYETQIAQVFSRHDRFGRSMVTKNSVFSGFTFFSRPRLCLADWNICGDRKLAHLMTDDVQSIPFAIKCLLDTKYSAKKDPNCPLLDKNNPFLVPLCNTVKSISGFLDPMLITESTEGGFFSEDQTYVIGGDRLARTYDINCMFRDLPGNPILTIIDDWCQYMHGLSDGSLQQYSEAIDFNRMDYTVSIYRFLMDITNRYIVRWAKCTGCYPVSTPSGIPFNLNEGEHLVSAASDINVPFKANRIEYDDPIILKEFNMLVRRYATDANIDGGTNAFAHNVASNNFCGVPYIRPTNKGYELLWLARKGMVGELFQSSGGNINIPKRRSADKEDSSWL